MRGGRIGMAAFGMAALLAGCGGSGESYNYSDAPPEAEIVATPSPTPTPNPTAQEVDAPVNLTIVDPAGTAQQAAPAADGGAGQE